MLAIFTAVSVGDEIDQAKEWLLHAHIASLLDGLEAGHIDKETYAVFLDVLRQKLRDYRLVEEDGTPTSAKFRAEPLWNLFVDVVATTAETIHSNGKRISLADTRRCNDDYCGQLLLTLGRLEFQANLAKLAAVALKRKRIMLSRADIVRKSGDRKAIKAIVDLCNYALENGLSQPLDYLKGSARSITWMTPVEGVVSGLVERGDEFGLTKRDLTTLRDLLGLYAENGSTKRPLAVFFVKCQAGLTAPNVFTAQGYERFRHRPSDTLSVCPSGGLTYNMDRKAALANPGATEIVSEAIVLPQISMIMAGGQPAPSYTGRNTELESHRIFCEHVLRGRAISEIIDRMQGLSP